MLGEETAPTSNNIEIEENNEILYAIAKIANKVVNDIANRYVEPIAKNVENVRRILDIKVIKKAEDDFASVLAVDSTWTKPFIELVIGDIAVIATGYVIVAPAGIGSYGIAYIGLRRGAGEDSKFSNDVELDAKIMEFITAEKKMGNIVDMVMLDGSLYYSTIPEFFSPMNVTDIISFKGRVWGSRLASLASSALIKLLRKADELSVPVIGVVKRVASRFLLPIIAYSGLKDVENALIKTNDKFILSLSLKQGEYVVLDSYLETLKQYLSYITKKYSGVSSIRARKVLEILSECHNAENSMLQELCRYMDNTSTVFYRHVGDAMYPQAIRLDIYPKKAVERVINYAMYNTSQNCVPIPIDYVDRYVRLESFLIKKVYGILRSYVKNVETMTAMSPTNPQKYYLFENIWM